MLKSMPVGSLAVDLAAVVRNEITLQGSRCGPFDRAIDMLAAGEISTHPLITHRFTLGRIGEAFDAVAKGEAIKVLLEIGGGDN